MTFTPTPRAIGFPEPEVPMGHVPILKTYSDEDHAAYCLRCHKRVTAVDWAKGECPGASN